MDYKKIVEKSEDKKTDKQQAKLTFNRVHKIFTNYDSYTFNEEEILRHKPIYLGFSVLVLSKLLMFESHYDKLQPYFGEKDI